MLELLSGWRQSYLLTGDIYGDMKENKDGTMDARITLASTEKLLKNAV